MKTLDAFLEVAQRKPVAGLRWIEALETVTATELDILVDTVPPQRITSTAGQFAKALLRLNKGRLIDAKEILQ